VLSYDLIIDKQFVSRSDVQIQHWQRGLTVLLLISLAVFQWTGWLLWMRL